MRYWQQLFLIMISLLMMSACATSQALDLSEKKTARAPQMVILKLDDIFDDNGAHPGWTRTFDYLNKEGITGTIGLVGQSLEHDNEALISWLLAQHAMGHEIWNHGYCHCKPEENGVEMREFRGTSYDYQLTQIQKTQEIAQEKLGLTLTSFGAPYNSTDSSTARALSKVEDISVWMFKETTAETDKKVLNRIAGLNIEYPVHNPDFNAFKEAYALHKDKPLLVIQGHPRSWVDDPARFERFVQIVDFLKAQGVIFTTPRAVLKN